LSTSDGAFSPNHRFMFTNKSISRVVWQHNWQKIEGVIKTVLTIVKSKIRSASLLDNSNVHGRNLLQVLLLKNKNHKWLQEFLDVLKNAFDIAGLKKIEKLGANCLGLASKKNNAVMIEVLWGFRRILLSSHERKQLLKETNN
jgi:hypothetical protein